MTIPQKLPVGFQVAKYDKPDTQTRQKFSAAVQMIDQAAVLMKISGPIIWAMLIS